MKPVTTCCLLSLLFTFCMAQAQPKADSLLEFIVTHKDKASLCIVRNDTVIAEQLANRVMPLASTVKILVAVEFAKQAGSNVINENSYVPLKELDKYYIAHTDGDAHPDWLKYERAMKHISNDSIKLIDVARGMIMFSSNANTEFLMDLLGLDNIKNNIQLFGLKDHTAVYPLVSSLFLYQNPKKVKEEKILKAIGKMDEATYCKNIDQIHAALKYGTALKQQFNIEDLSEPMQHLWSDRLPAASVKSYIQLCSILNQRKYLDKKSYAVLSKVLETIMENPLNKKIYQQFGLKNGSTGFVLTEAFYATVQSGDRYEAAYFFNNISSEESERIQGWINDFRIAITQNSLFREKAAIRCKQ